jgi:RNA polymerase sigma factor (sigma-70 family)
VTSDDAFVVALASASRRARRHLRGLEKADREDVISTALLWCLEHKSSYNPTVQLDTWFVGAIRDARKAYERKEAQRPELFEVVTAPDDTAWTTEAREAIRHICRSMDIRDRAIVRLSMEGMEQSDIARHAGIPLRTVERKLARLRAMIPARIQFQATRRGTGHDSDDGGPEAPIDREIERLEFAPPAGKDCAPCWRCKWFDGYVPDKGTIRRSGIQVEPEIRAAVLETEARKVQIANNVRRK